MSEILKSPFPYFGGKSKVADVVWRAFGAVDNYVEPFFGSGAVLLGRPGWRADMKLIETVNDADGFICNFWRALKMSPDAVTEHADWPVNECDLEARHLWLVNRRGELTEKLNDPDYYDAKAAGWWVWGACCWIGSGWCSGVGPWIYDVEARRIVNSRQLPHLGNAGQGVNRQRPHLGNAGRGVNRKLPATGLSTYLRDLADRLRHVRVCCGDWLRVTGPCVTVNHGITGVFLDPPYSAEADRDMGCYAIDCGKVAHDVHAWCKDLGDDPRMRIALCGYTGEGHDYLTDIGWCAHSWSANGGYETQSVGVASGNRHRETIWFSPHCLAEMELF